MSSKLLLKVQPNIILFFECSFLIFFVLSIVLFIDRKSGLQIGIKTRLDNNIFIKKLILFFFLKLVISNPLTNSGAFVLNQWHIFGSNDYIAIFPLYFSKILRRQGHIFLALTSVFTSIIIGTRESIKSRVSMRVGILYSVPNNL